VGHVAGGTFNVGVLSEGLEDFWWPVSKAVNREDDEVLIQRVCGLVVRVVTEGVSFILFP
jgi:hypothetical protein